jgi:signal transduction histidine kinase
MQPTFTENGAVKQYIAIITDVTKQKELEEQVELEKLIKQKEITQAVFTAQENERSHIGRELHDNVNQLLGATHLYIDMSRKNQKDRDSLLDSASTYTYNAIQEIRKLSKILITPLINDVGLIDSIKYLTEEIMLVHPIKIVSNANDHLEEGLSQQFKLNIFRIVQEQINNILKHAKAKNIVITISENAGKVLFSIADDGIGFDVGKRKPGIGITNIKSRCELYNCTMKLSSQPGKGTTLSISFNKKD